MKQVNNPDPVDVRMSSLDELQQNTNLTRNQLGFWLGQRVAPSSSIYNMGELFRVECDVDPVCFKAAFCALVDRSDALRTRFLETDGVPEQVVAESLDFVVPVVDISSAEDSEEKLSQWCSDRISQPMELAERCFDVALIKLGQRRWVWYLCLHHLIGDGTSVDLIFRYVDEFYGMAVKGQLDDVDRIPQFASFRQKEREYRGSEACARDAKFWHPRLNTACEPVDFYGNRCREGENRCVRKVLDLELSRTEKLVSVAEQVLGAGISVELNVLTAYFALLAVYQLRVSGRRLLVVGIPFHNRTSQADKHMIGLMMEVVPLTLEVGPDDTYSCLLKKAKSEIVAVMRHYRYGCSNASRSKNYDVMLNLLPSATNEFGGLPATADWLHSGQWNESLTLQVQRSESGERLYFDMNCALFRGDLALRAPEHFGNLLDSLVEAPDQPIQEAEMLTAAERELLRRSLSNSGRKQHTDETIVSHFEAAVNCNPQALAVIDGKRHIDYRSLNDMANRLAGYLQSQGLREGDCIGICLPRSIERITAIVAILKVGGAYVPVDETWPAKRIGQMLEDASVRTIVTQSANIDALSVVMEVDLIDLEESAEHILRQSSDNLVVSLSTVDAAYINFTSGSTGRPKGVIVPHSGVIRLVVDADYVDLDESTVTLNMSSISFDASTFEIWGALLSGGTLVLPSQSLPGAASIRHYIETCGVNTLFVTTSLFNALIDEDPQAFVGINQLLTGGESASTQHFSRAKAALPDTRLSNVYGPTECTTFATCYPVPEDFRLDEPVPIGSPISNTFAHVLDANLQQVPVGATGELYIGGAGVALGYAAQPALTEERFVQLPPGGDTRVYRTGDTVQIRDDGTLVFLGRRDNQVKIHGFRIELDEVELALHAMSEVRRAVVLLHEAGDGTKGLAAYISPAQPGLTVAELRSSLRDRLPKSMIPRWFVLVDELPLGTTGKVDRRLLPDPETVPVLPQDFDSLPMTSDEEHLAKIWCDLLRIPRVSLDENFFELGGDSIVAIQFAARAAATGLSFDAEDVFENPTIRALSQVIADQRGEVPDKKPNGGEVPAMPARFADAGLDSKQLDDVLAEIGLGRSKQ